MSHQSSGRVRLSGSLALVTFSALTYLLLGGCASVGSQPAVYTENPKGKAQKPCQAQTAGAPATQEPCTKPQ